MATVTTETTTTTTPAPDGSDARRITLEILDCVFGAAMPDNIACRLWDGTRWPTDAPDNVVATIVLNHPGTLRRMFLPPTERAIGEAFVRGDFDIEGDLETALKLNDVLFTMPRTPATMVGLLQLVRQLPEIDTQPIDGRG